jgi:hypothetical protein
VVSEQRRRTGQCRRCDARCRGLVAIAPAVPHLTDGFITVYSAPRGSKHPKALLCHNGFLHDTVVLLHDVVEVLHWSMPASARQVARALQTRDGRRVNASEISVDDASSRSAVADRGMRISTVPGASFFSLSR